MEPAELRSMREQAGPAASSLSPTLRGLVNAPTAPCHDRSIAAFKDVVDCAARENVRSGVAFAMPSSFGAAAAVTSLFSSPVCRSRSSLSWT